MQSALLFILGIAGLVAGIWLLRRSRSSRSNANTLGGALLALIGVVLIINGFWSAGTLVADGGTQDSPSVVGETATPGS